MNRNDFEDLEMPDPPSFVYVAINDCIGRFEISKAAMRFMCIDADRIDILLRNREHPQLIGAIKILGESMVSGPMSEIKLEQVPSDAIYEIESDCGHETIKIIARHPMIKSLRFGY